MFLFVPGKTITVIIIVTIITDHHQPSFSAPGLTNAKVSVGCPPLDSSKSWCFASFCFVGILTTFNFATAVCEQHPTTNYIGHKTKSWQQQWCQQQTTTMICRISHPHDAGVTGEPCVTSQHFNSFQYKCVISGNTRLAKRSSSIWYLLDKRDDGGREEWWAGDRAGLEEKRFLSAARPEPRMWSTVDKNAVYRFNIEIKWAEIGITTAAKWCLKSVEFRNLGISNCQSWIWLISGLFTWPVMMLVIQWSLIQTNNFGSLTNHVIRPEKVLL